MFLLAILKFAGAHFLDGAKDFHNQDAMIGDDSAAAFADDIRVRDILGVADIGHVINDVIGIFLERVVGGTVEGGSAAIVIHAQAPTHVYEFNPETHLVKLGVKPGGFLDRLFDDQDRSEERRVGKECRSRWSPY